MKKIAAPAETHFATKRMSLISFLKAAVGGAIVILCVALLVASPAHTPLSALPRAANTGPSAATERRFVAAQSLPQDRPPNASPRSSSLSASQPSSSSQESFRSTSQQSPDTRESPRSARAIQAEQFFFAQANRVRVEEGLAQLQWNEGLAGAARKHAVLMLNEGDLSHQFDGEPSLATRVSEVGVRFTHVGENVAFGPEPASMQAGWMESPGHRANILGASFNALGVGVLEEDGRLYAVEDFATVVEDLTIEQQEEKIAAQLTARGFLVTQDQNDLADARGICARVVQTNLLTPARHNMEILRYEAPDLSIISPEMAQRLRASRFKQAAVGACKGESGPGANSRFHVVILLFSGPR
jgi:uncharacterized protein YkwD